VALNGSTVLVGAYGANAPGVTIGAASGIWSLSLTIAGQTYTLNNLAFNVPTATLQSELQGLAGIGQGNVIVTGTAGSTYLLPFAGALGSATIPLGIVAGTASPTISQTTVASTNTINHLYSTPGTYDATVIVSYSSGSYTDLILVHVLPEYVQMQSVTANGTNLTLVYTVSGATIALPAQTTNASTTVTGLASTEQLSAGMTVNGIAIPAGDTIASILGPNSIQLSKPATATGNPTLTFSAPLSLGFYTSMNSLFDQTATLLTTVSLSGTDVTAGQHVKTLTIGSGTGQVPLPGTVGTDLTSDYYILAVADPLDQLPQEAAYNQNSAVLTGVYQAGGAVYVQCATGNDVLSLTATSGSVKMAYHGASGPPLTYTASTPLTAANLQAYLGTLPGLAAAGSVTVTGSPGGLFVVTFASGLDPTQLSVVSGPGNITSADVVLLTDNGSSYVQLNNGMYQFTTAVSGYTIRTHNGNDVVDASRISAPVSFWEGSGADTLTGGSGANTFYLPNTDPSSAIAGPGTNTLIGGAINNNWIISGLNSGTVNGVAFTGVANLIGGPDNDTFSFQAEGSLTGSITGGAGTDTLDESALTAPVNVNLTSVVPPTAYQLSSGGQVSINVPQLNTTAGGFTTVSFWMNWNGTNNSVMPIGFTNYDLWFSNNGGSNPSFGFNTWSSDIYGISSAGLANNWHYVTAVFNNGNVLLNQLWIDGVQQTLTQRFGTPNARNVSTAVRISGEVSSGTSFAFQGSLADVAFFNQELTAAQIQTEYNFRQGAVAYYSLSETSGSTALDSSGNGNNGTISALGVTLGASGPPGAGPILASGTATGAAGGFVNVGKFLGGSGTNTLTGPNTTNTWQITAANAGNINGITFSGFQNLVSGTGNDTFTFSNGASVSGSINGSGGTDSLNYAAYTTLINVNLTQQSDVQTVAIGASSGTWNLSLIIGGQTYPLSNLPYNIPTATLQSDLQGLTGIGTGNVAVTGTAGSSYVLSFGGTLANNFIPLGSVSGSASPSIVHTTIGIGTGNGTATAVGAGFSNIEGFVGGSSTNTLTAPNTTNTWQITAANAGNINGITFSGFQNLVGGTGNDTFMFSNGASVSGTINGGGGIDSLNYSAYTTPVSVTLNEQSDVQTLTIGASSGTWNLLLTIADQSFTLGNLAYNIPTATLQADLQALAGIGTGNVMVTGTAGSNYVLSFAGTLANTFIPLGSVSGTASPSIVHTAVGVGPTPVSVTLNGQSDVQTVTIGASSGTWNLLLTIADQSFMLGNLAYNIPTATLQADLQALAGIGTGNVMVTGTAGSNYVLSFAGTLANTFIPLGSVSGTASPSIVHTAVGVGPTMGQATGVGGGFSNIEGFVGGTAANTLTGPNTTSAWQITSANAGTVNGNAFSVFQNLVGGSGNNTFAFSNGASVSGSINGGSGSNTLDDSNYTTTVNINLTTNTATSIGGGFSNIQCFLGGTAANVATFSTSSLAVATNTITAVYSGDSSFSGTTSQALSQTVNPDNTSTSLTSSSGTNPLVFGQSVTFTATVKASSPGSGTPTGTVAFKDGTATLGAGILNGSGTATFSISSLAVATHSITAVYSGDNSFSASTSAAVSQPVISATTTSVITSQATVTYGTPITLTATVSDNAGITAPLQGSVEFFNGTTDLGAGLFQSISGTSSLWSLTTGARQLNAGSSQDVHAVYAAGIRSSTGTLTGGETVTKRALTVTAVTSTKTYDGTASAAATPTITSGSLVTGDTPNFTEGYASRNVGTNFTLTPSGSVSDSNGGGNYIYNFVPVSTGVINKATLTISAVSDSKTYDGTSADTATPTYQVTGQPANTLFSGDSFTTLKQTFLSRNALGTNASTLQVSASISDGNNGGNYSVTTQTVTGTINKAALTISAVSDSKTYDGTTSDTATPAYLVTGQPGNTLFSGDSFTTLKQTFLSKNALGTNGSTLQVSASISDGNSGGNYSVTTQTATGTINKAALTISAVSDSKTYDGTTADTTTPTYQVTGQPANTLFSGDSFTRLKQTFLSKNALGTNGSTLQVSASINDGNSGGNYSVTTNTATGTITPAALTITAATNTKTYDSTTSAAATPTIPSASLAAGDTGSFVETYDTPNAGTGKALTPSGSVSDGNSGHNYTYHFVLISTGVIDQAGTAVTLQSNNNPASVGQQVTFSASVTGGSAGSPGGIVTFKDGTTALGTGTLGNGVATLQATFPSSSQHIITAV